MGLFQHGEMAKPDYVFGIVRSHLARAGWPESVKSGFVALELGPGDSVASGMVTNACGASHTYLVDTGDYATHEMETYRKLAAFLHEKNVLSIPHLLGTEFSDLLSNINTRYLTNGLQSFRTIPDRSVNIIWSQAVLEHVRRNEFDATIAEFRRILAPGGACSHRIDLSDHLGGALNNLRFSESAWESDFMANSGFYTNRIRFSEMIEIFHRNNFLVKVVKKDLWPNLPTPRIAFAKRFKSYSEEDLLVKGFEVVLS